MKRFIAAALLAVVAIASPTSTIAQTSPVTNVTLGALNAQAALYCPSGQSSAVITEGAGLTGTVTVTTSAGSSASPLPSASPFAIGNVAGGPYLQTLTGAGKLYVGLASDSWVYAKVTAYTSGSAVVSIQCSGAVLSRVVGTANVANVTTFGAKCDGATDDSAAIQAALSYVSTSTTASTLVFPIGTCMAHGLVLSGSNVTLQGGGPGFTSFVAFAAVAPKSEIKCNNAGDTVLSIKPPAGNNIIARDNVVNMAFGSNASSCAKGLYVQEAGGVFQNLQLGGFTTAALNVHGGPLTGGGKGDSIANDFESISIDDSNALSGDGILCDGEQSNNGNCDYNVFRLINIYGNNGVPVHLGWSDANWFSQVHVTRVGGGTGIGMVFDCGAHSNRVSWMTSASGFAVRGTATCPGGNPYNNPATSNTVDHYDIWDNGSPKPTLETGSIGNNWSDDRGNTFYQINPSGQTQSFLAFGASNASTNIPADGVPMWTTNLAGDRWLYGCQGTGQSCPISFDTGGFTDGIKATITSAGIYQGAGLTSISAATLTLLSSVVASASVAAVKVKGTDASCSGTNLVMGWYNSSDTLNASVQCNGFFNGGFKATQIFQQSSAKWATRVAMVAGTVTFTYATAFGSTPVCVASTEGTNMVHVSAVSTTACTVTSASGADTSTVDIIVIGNPT